MLTFYIFHPAPHAVVSVLSYRFQTHVLLLISRIWEWSNLLWSVTEMEGLGTSLVVVSNRREKGKLPPSGSIK